MAYDMYGQIPPELLEAPKEGWLGIKRRDDGLGG